MKFFMQEFFADYCQLPFSRMHEEFFQDESDPYRRGRRDAIAAPRSHAKTTIKMRVKAVHSIVYGYEHFILILGYSKDHAEAKVQEILTTLTEPQIVSVYGDLTSKDKTLPHPARGGKCGFVTTNGIRLLPRSREQEIRGLGHKEHRPTLIICDDVENLEEVQSPDIRFKVRDWFFKTVMKVGEINDSTNITLIGTCLHQESLLSELLLNPGWNGRKYQAIERFSQREDLWEAWRKIFTNRSNPNRLQDAEVYYQANETEMLRGTKVLWPEGDSYLKLMKQMVSDGQASFYSEKQNDPYDPERQIFKMDEAKRFELIYDGHAPKEIRWLDGSGKVIPWSHIRKVIAFHDPAMGEEPKKKNRNDFGAIVVVAVDQEEYLYCLDAWIEREHHSKQIEAALALHRRWNLDVLYLESNNFQGVLKTPYYTAQEKLPTKRLLRILGVHQHRSKVERIQGLEPFITHGDLLFSTALPKRLIDQMILFPTGHDDGPDALQGAVEQLIKRIPGNMITGPIDTNDCEYINPAIMLTGGSSETPERKKSYYESMYEKLNSLA